MISRFDVYRSPQEYELLSPVEVSFPLKESAKKIGNFVKKVFEFVINVYDILKIALGINTDSEAIDDTLADAENAESNIEVPESASLIRRTNTNFQKLCDALDKKFNSQTDEDSIIGLPKFPDKLNLEFRFQKLDSSASNV